MIKMKKPFTVENKIPQSQTKGTLRLFEEFRCIENEVLVQSAVNRREVGRRLCARFHCCQLVLD